MVEKSLEKTHHILAILTYIFMWIVYITIAIHYSISFPYLIIAVVVLIVLGFLLWFLLRPPFTGPREISSDNTTPSLHEYGDWAWLKDEFYNISDNSFLKIKDTVFPIFFKSAWINTKKGLDIDLNFDRNENWRYSKERAEDIKIDCPEGFKKQKFKSAVNWPIYALCSIGDEKNNVNLSFKAGWYFGYISTCELVSWEWRRVRENIDETEKIPSLRYRSRYFPGGWPTEFPNINKQHWKLGINVFTVMKDSNTDSGWRCFLSRRSDQVDEFPKYWHVAPAGTFQPTVLKGEKPSENPSISNRYHETDFDIRNSILKEYWEEFFKGEKEVEGMDLGNFDDPIDWLLDKEPVQELTNLLETGGADLAVTGLGIDIMYMKPEMAAILVIKDDEYYEKYRNHKNKKFRFKPSYEFNDYSLENKEQAWSRIPEFNAGFLEEIRSRRIIPGGAFSIHLGSQWFEENIEELS